MNLLGDDIDKYKEAFTASAMKKKVRIMLRTRREKTDDSQQISMGFLGDLKDRRMAVKQSNGKYLYKVFPEMKWADLIAVYNGRKEGVERDQREIQSIEAAMRILAPVMALNPDIVVRQAVKTVQQDAAE